MKNVLSVVVIVDNVVSSIKSYDGNFYNAAEKDFEALVRAEDDTLTDDEIDNIIDDGVYETENGSICLSHSM